MTDDFELIDGDTQTDQVGLCMQCNGEDKLIKTWAGDYICPNCYENSFLHLS